jgi:hypothetical protein
VFGLSQELTTAALARSREEKERGVGEERGERIGLDINFLVRK